MHIGASTTGSGAHSSNTNSYIEQAWKRVKDYWSVSEKKASDSASDATTKSKSETKSETKSANSTEAEAKATV